MKWLKKIFGWKEKEEAPIEEVELRMEDLDSWLDKKTSGLMSELKEKIASLYPRINEGIKKVSEKAVILSKVDLSEKKVDERVKKIVEDNRDSYVSHVNSFVRGIKVPEDSGYSEAIAFHSLFSSKLGQLAKNSFRNLRFTSELIGEESVAVNEGLRGLGDLANELKGVVTEEKVQMFNKVKKAMKELKGLHSAKGKFKSEEESILLKEKEKEHEISALQEEIKRLKESSEHKELKVLIDERGEVNQKVGNVDFQIRNIFAPIQKAMQKFLQMNKDSPDEKALKEYVDDNVNALVNDEEMKITGLFTRIKEALIEGRIELKEKKKEQTLKVLKEMDVDVLKGFVERRKTLEKAMKELDEKISAVEVIKKIEDAGKRLSDLENAKENLGKEVGKLRGRQERISFEELEKKIVSGIELVTNARVKLSYS